MAEEDHATHPELIAALMAMMGSDEIRIPMEKLPFDVFMLQQTRDGDMLVLRITRD